MFRLGHGQRIRCAAGIHQTHKNRDCEAHGRGSLQHWVLYSYPTKPHIQHQAQCGVTLNLFHIGNDRVQAARAGRLGPDEFRGLNIPLDVRGADGHLIFALLERMPTVIPNDP